MNTFRGFIAVEIPSSAKINNLFKQIEQLPCNLKLVEPENIHITVKFLGETQHAHLASIESIMKQVVQDIKPFPITLQGTGFFPNQSYIKVIWIGIKHTDQLNLIANKLNEELQILGYKKEKKQFSAHLTIARMKSAKGKEAAIDLIKETQEIHFTDFTVSSIQLKKSTLTPKGPIYETMLKAPLH